MRKKLIFYIYSYIHPEGVYCWKGVNQLNMQKGSMDLLCSFFVIRQNINKSACGV